MQNPPYSRYLHNYFYRAKDLDEKWKIRAKRQGFRHVRGIELDGSICGGGFYIKKRTALAAIEHDSR